MDPCVATGGAGSSVPVVAFLSALGAVFVAGAFGRWLDPATADKGRPPARFGIPDIVRLVSPVIAALAVTLIFFGALEQSGIFGWNVIQTPEFIRIKIERSITTEAASQITWALSAAAVLITGLIVIWVAGDAVRASHAKAIWIALPGVAIAGGAAGYSVGAALQHAGFGGALSEAMLRGLTCRNDKLDLFAITDALNALAGGAAVAAIFTACLMAAPASDVAHRAASAELARRWRILDRLLYAGAAMLIAGMIEVIALHSWALAPFAGTAEVKAQAELCKAAADPTGIEACRPLQQSIDRAGTVDELRQFVRTLAITLGAGFSLLLASLYVPAAIVLQLRAARAGLKAEAHAGDPRDSERGLEGAPSARLFKIAATVAPLATGLLSALVGMKFS